MIAVVTTPYDHIQNYFLDYRLRHALLTADSLKRQHPDVPLAICGAHGTVRPDIIFRDCSADYVVRGEFDSALPELAISLAEGGATSAATIRRGDTIGPVGAEGAVAQFRLVDLDQRFRTKRLPAEDIRPAYDLIDLNAYHGDFYEGAYPTRRQRWVTVLANRGCAYDCDFCFNFWGRRTRRRPAEEVADELAWLEREQGASAAFFIDFNFTEDRRWIERFCADIIRRGTRLPWLAQTRCDLVDAALLREMRAAGCSGLWFGVESFDAAVARGLSKYSDVDAAANALAACGEAGIKPHIFVMIGAPGETRRSINATIRQMHHWKAAYCGVMPTAPRFGTALYAEAKQQFPALGGDFYSLRGVRGLVGNELRPDDIHEGLQILNDRRFMENGEPAQLSI